MVIRRIPMPASPTSTTDTSPTISQAPEPVDILILGAGWTSTFLLPLLTTLNITHAATTTTGKDNTIPFTFDPASSSTEAYKNLPNAKTVLITFPLKGKGQSETLVSTYAKSRCERSSGRQEEQQPAKRGKRLYIQLGSTGIFTATHWNDSTSSYDTSNARAIAEDELLSLSVKESASPTSSPRAVDVTTTVLNLAGLYGGTRQPRAWLPRIIKKRSDVAGRKALHLVHGADVARAVVGAHENVHGAHRGGEVSQLSEDSVVGKRWIITDLHVYDWWDLVVHWATASPSDSSISTFELRHFPVQSEDGLKEETLDLQKTVFELMQEQGVRALPRSPEDLGRVLDGRGFWGVVGSHPGVGRVN